MNDMKTQIKAHIDTATPGQVWVLTDFTHLGSRGVVDQALQRLVTGGPRLLFKGGTSLSKAFALISRFSEDIDITVFREDIGEPAGAAGLDPLSRKQRRIRLDRIRTACQRYIAKGMATQLREITTHIMPIDRFRLELDPDDPAQQTLLF